MKENIGDQLSSATSKSKNSKSGEKVKVFVRIRPLSSKEAEKGTRDISLCNYEQNILALQKPDGEQTKLFKFDGLFGPHSDQGLIYKNVALPVVEQVLRGYNGTIFAYGQTGTGKTYTMSGASDIPENKGIIPNTFSHIFTHIAQASNENSFTVTVAYLEIYNEEVRDLLVKDSKAKLQIRERKDIGIFVHGLTGFTVTSESQMTEIFTNGNKNRMTRATKMNDVSSRSHAVFQISIDTTDRKTESTYTGKLNLVDLAGSERVSRTEATGDRLREAGAINQSLSTLGQVISSLAEGKTTLPPFRNSKLTRLLTDSLGGNSKTSMIAMLSPADIDYEETMCTLRYAQRAKNIQNHAVVNVNSNTAIYAGFQKELVSLYANMRHLNERLDKVLMTREKTERNHELDMEIQRIQQQKEMLQEKISQIHQKIMVGGENLIDKVQQQEFLLLSSGKEIEQLDKSNQELEDQLSKFSEEKGDIEEKYSTLQEEDIALNKKIKKIQQLIKDEKDEYADKEQEYQREMENLTENNKLLNRESQLAQVMIETYIPPQYLEKIKENLIFNSETQEYQMRGVAYTGNNMRKSVRPTNDFEQQIDYVPKNPYHKYPDKKIRIRERRLLKCYSAVPQTR